MHSLVQWRAIHRDQNQQWEWWYTKFILAACSQIKEEDHQPQFRRHLTLHVPDMSNIDLSCIKNIEMGEVFIWNTLARVHYDEGRWEEAEQLFMQVIETSKTKLSEDHPNTLNSMAHLAFIWKSAGHDAEAISLLRECLTKQKQTLGLNHPITLSNSVTLLAWETEVAGDTEGEWQTDEEWESDRQY